ncbi:MAG: tail fiber domain-containing protein, partial [Candidatus Pacebacteria bacterium]|nr:tail fiber domain-containing protein [Candidatus Paceibacterota bacterium]
FKIYVDDSDSDKLVIATSSSANLLTIMQNGYVGIGTSSSQSLLDVSGVIRSTDYTGMPPAGTGGIGVELYYYPDISTGYLLSFDRSGGEYKKLVMEGVPLLLNEGSGGNVGIGTTTPNATLSIKAVTNVRPFQIASSSGSDLLVVDTNGYVGIGTSAPQDTLDVNGSIITTGIQDPSKIMKVFFAGASDQSIDYDEYSSDDAAQAAYVSGFSYYRLKITAVNAGGSLIGQVQVYNGANLITPSNMTSTSTPSPYVSSASSSWEGDSNWRIWYAFDSYIGSSPSGHMGWHYNSVLPNWIKIYLGQAYPATSYKIYSTSHNYCPSAWTFEGSNTGAFSGEEAVLDSRSGIANWGADTAVTYGVNTLIAYSESTIVNQGSYSLKVVAPQTTSLNNTLTRTLGSPINLTGANTIKLDIRSSRTGSNIKIGLHDSGGVTTETTPDVTSADAWQTVSWDVSGVSNGDKDAIDRIIVTITNADATTTFYLDNMYATGGVLNDIAFTTNGTERMRINSAGNLGLGSTTPASLLSVAGNSYFAGDSTTTGNNYFVNLSAGSIPFIGTNGLLSQNNSNLYWDNTNSRLGIGSSTPYSTLDIRGIVNTNPFRIASSSGASLLTIDQSGNIGLGTASPTVKFDFGSGSVGAPSDNSAGMKIKMFGDGSGNNDWGMGVNTNEWWTLLGGATSATKYNIYANSATPAALFTIQGDGKVGIGTTTPSVPLHIVGTDITGPAWVSGDDLAVFENNDYANIFLLTATSGYATIGFADKDNRAAGFIQYYHGTDLLTFGANGNSRMTITNNGKVGINTQAPTTTLEVYDTATSTLTITSASSTARDAVLSFRTGATPTENFKIYVDDSDSDKLVIATSTSGNLLTITQGGYLGIGTSSPSWFVQIKKDQNNYTPMILENATAGSAARTLFALVENNATAKQLEVGYLNTSFTLGAGYETMPASAGYILANSGATGGLSIITGADAPIQFSTGGTATANKRMIITGAGNIGVGTTTPDKTLTVRGVANINPFGVASSSGVDLLTVNQSGNIGIGTSSPSYKLDVGGAIRQTNAQNCAVLNADADGQLICTESSLRYKENIEDLSFDQDKFLSLEPRTFTFKKDLPFNMPGGQIGFIAEEVESIFPELVQYKDGQLDTVKYQNLPIYLYAIVKEQQKEIENLKALSVQQNIGGSLVLAEPIRASLASIGIEISASGAIGVKKIKTEEIEVGSPEKRTGITIYDEETGEPYCIKMKAGAMISVVGKCEVLNPANLSGSKGLVPGPNLSPEAFQQVESTSASALQPEAQVNPQEQSSVEQLTPASEPMEEPASAELIPIEQPQVEQPVLQSEPISIPTE